MSRILAIDYGLKRVGIAVTDPLKIFAQPLTTIESSELISFLKNYFLKENVETIILGYPTNLDQSDTHLTQSVLKIKEQLFIEFNKDIILIDERLTSKMAKQTLFDAGYKKKDRQNKKLLDSVSASLILQTYLETI